MADVKISQLTALASASTDVAGDVLAIVDTSATQTKKISVENLLSPITIDKSAGTITSLGTVTGNATFGANVNITGDLSIGAHANGDTTGHAVLNLAADANQGADSYINFNSGTTTRGHIAYDHNTTVASQSMKFVTGNDAVTAMNINGDGRVIIRSGLLEVGEHGVAGAQIVSDGDLVFHAGYNDSSTGNGNFTFKRYGESTTANTMATIFSTGNAFFGDSQTQTNSSHFQYASTFAQDGYARVGFFNQATGNDAGRGMSLAIGQLAGASNYQNVNTELGVITFLGQGADDAYVGGSIATKVTTGGAGVNRAGVGCDMIFSTMDTSTAGATERMRIASSGNVGIGTDNPFAKLHINETTNGQELIFLNHSVTGADQTYVQFRHDSTLRGTIKVTDSNDQIAYNTTNSDKRLKKDFENWDESVLPSFKSLKPQLFNFIHSENNGGKRKGYIAQDNVDNFPEAYSIGKVLDGDDTEYYSFNPSGMVAYLMKAVQELTEKVEALENA